MTFFVNGWLNGGAHSVHEGRKGSQNSRFEDLISEDTEEMGKRTGYDVPIIFMHRPWNIEKRMEKGE